MLWILALKVIIPALLLFRVSRSFRSTRLQFPRLLSSFSKMANAQNNPLLEDWSVNEFALPPFARIEASHFKPAFDSAMESHIADLQKIVDNKEDASFQNVCEVYDRAGGDLTKISHLFSNLCSSVNTEAISEVRKSVCVWGVHASDESRCHPSSRGAFASYLALSVCVFFCVTYLFYCNVTTLTPLYVRPLNQTTNLDQKQQVQTEMAPLLAGHDSKVYTLPGLFNKIDAVYNSRQNAGLTSEQVSFSLRFKRCAIPL